MKKFSRREFIPLAGMTLLGTSCLANSETLVTDQIARTDRIRPKTLNKGDVVAICAPAGGIKDQSEISDFQKVLEDLGYKTIVGDEVAGRYGYFSATDEERASSLMSMVENPEVKGIFFIRGGWGCARILDLLDYETIKANPKVILGFSDITSLLIAITEKSNLITFHGPGGNSTWNDYSIDKVNKALSPINPLVIEQSNKKLEALSSGECVGELVGGNLSIVCSLLGTDYEPDWNNKVLFLEEVAEEPYRIDRMLVQLKMNGVFDKVSGIILGGFRKCEPEEKDRSFTTNEVFTQHLNNLSIPVVKGVPFGHVREKFTIPVGVNVYINTDTGTIRTLNPAVQ